MNSEACPSRESGQRVSAVFFLIAAFGSAVAVPLCSMLRMSEVWFGTSLLGFIGVPVLFGVWKTHPTMPYLFLALGLLMACPAIYWVLDFWEPGRDAFFLMTGTNILFVSTTWAVDSVRSRLWTRTLIAAVGIVIEMSAIFVMLWMYIYFE